MHCNLDACLQESLALFEAQIGEPFPAESKLTLQDDNAFWAMVRRSENGYAIHCNNGTEQSIRVLWDEVLIHQILRDHDGTFIGRLRKTNATEDLTRISLTWLMMHELMHISMGHFELIDELEIVGRSASKPSSPPKLDVAAQLGCEPLIIRHCLEMQADWQSGELLLSAVDPNDYAALRVHSVAIMAVIMLIERGNMLAGTQDRDHPSAAARFFMLMAGLFQRWMYERGTLKSRDETSRIDLDEAPNEEELKAYANGLVKPVVDDVIVIATAIGLKDFIADMRGDGAIFQDIFAAQYGEETSEDSFGSKGAKEWARLIVVNEQLMQLTRLREAD